MGMRCIPPKRCGSGPRLPVDQEDGHGPLGPAPHRISHRRGVTRSTTPQPPQAEIQAAYFCSCPAG